MYASKHPEIINYDLSSPIIVTASYDRDKKIRVYAEKEESTEIELIQQFDFYDSQVNSLALYKNWLAIAGFDTIKIYDVANNQKEVASNKHDHEQSEHNHNSRSSNRQQKLYKVGYRNEMKILFTNDGNSLFSCNERGIITWWSFITFKLSINKQINVNKIVSSIAIHPNQEMLAIITKTGEIYFWKFNASCIYYLFMHIDDSLISVDFSDDGNYLAIMNTKGNVWVWSDFSLKCQPMKKFNFIEKAGKFQKTQYALKLKFSPDSKVLTIIGSDGMIKVYDVLYDFVILYEHIVKKPKSDHHHHHHVHSHRSGSLPWVS
jgi:WD40 repeat protein